MKRLFPLFSALAAVPFVALLLVSLGYTLGEASLLAVMFLPGSGSPSAISCRKSGSPNDGAGPCNCSI